MCQHLSKGMLGSSSCAWRQIAPLSKDNIFTLDENECRLVSAERMEEKRSSTNGLGLREAPG